MSDKFTSVEQQASYGVGRQLGEQLAANSFEGLDIPAVQAGLADAFDGKESVVSMEDMQVAFSEISQRLQKAQEEAAEAASAEGNAFLAENAKREGVVTTESGLQYEIINEGSGEKPSYDSNVRTHYHGTFIDGKVFDSSVTRGQPAEFPVSGVIAGWTEALQLMPVGAKYKLYVPHHLAYGERGAGAAIPPYSTLVFEVELLDIL
ncbi:MULTISPECIES: FKBP-type peptidyl-prolyl cis-trans isomerase [Shewanella]|jgi:FKBP-type peptidyl-prolyl cis-trans isomerase FklB|uniref:Peptidyl-prolyl cis-trans isomerase n=1 Tax=Shewanella chilikensis TaxID=558541 RepID=A0A6G7LP84_9GAMM|nr:MULTISPECIES: FKBP-type peptidyl-prolyl cis-trans isomerase [Shewanella]MBZ4679493.1 peptidylprolyl isomerase [Shewanella sp.]MCA0950808.1 FKBP-type peptidyl-prolyl cis-trans isomerase [Shewanella chilikensis]MCL1163741.1 FKBP-type peptidyl-prolyl cis-trans isomerase [Shewanella chilikensis]QIJ03636.1 FKBP-type peptidyl-prolyl cis-trans isomerase [Shewanella chilikensis]HCD12715.1 peptidylprolyl isomerase [Shewanella sp.]